MKKVIISVSVLLCMVLVLSSVAFADSSNVIVQKENAMAGSTFNLKLYHASNVPIVTNDSPLRKTKENHTVKTSPLFNVKGHYESKLNVIKPAKFKGKDYIFKTSLFLPTRILSDKDEYSPQNLFIIGKYLYELRIDKNNSNSGFFVRYDYEKLEKMGLTRQGNPAKRIREAYQHKFQGLAPTATEEKIFKCIKIGPKFEVGHGQAVAYNPNTGEIWMAMDLRDKNGKLLKKYETMTEFRRINVAKMKPDGTAIQFEMRTWTQEKAGQPGYGTPFTMAFDSQGNGYFTRYKQGEGYWIFKFNISDDLHVTVEPVQRFKYGLNTQNHIQNMSYNPALNTINLIANDALMSINLDNMGKLKAKDFSYDMYKSGREFETITFDAKGYAYLLTTKGAELLKSTKK